MQLERQSDGRYIGEVSQLKETDMIYAVNRKTKEHFATNLSEWNMNKWPHSKFKIIECDADGWIEWHGGKCPLSDGSRFDAKTRGGTQHPGCRGWRWDHKDVVSDIIAYRPIPEGKPQSPEWDGEGLPPVRACVEVRRNDNDWPIVKVVAHDDGGIIYRDPATTDHRYQWAIGSGIRPIRTDREKWIEAAEQLSRVGNTETVLGRIYDALESGELPQP